MQKMSKISDLPAIAGLFLNAMSGAYKAFKYRAMRKK